MSGGSANERLKAILKAGRLFEGKYRILKPLGAGSFAVVVHARHEVMGRDVALKFLKPKVVEGNPEVGVRFVKEVQIAARLRHPNVVTIFDFGKTEGGINYMVQEFVDGVTFDELMPPGVPLPCERALNIIAQLLSCLEEAHANNIIHRDLKPSNLMSTKHKDTGDEVIKVLDFGVAKLLDDKNRTKDSTRQSTKFIGTPIYMSPEQILGQEVGPVSDLYSVGLMLYEMLTGDPPIEAEQVAEVVQKHLSNDAFAFPKLSLLPQNLQHVILKATQRRPELRFQHASHFIEALDDPSYAVSEEYNDTDLSMTPLGGVEQQEVDDVFSGKNYIAMPEEDYGDSEFQPSPVLSAPSSFGEGLPGLHPRVLKKRPGSSDAKLGSVHQERPEFTSDTSSHSGLFHMEGFEEEAGSSIQPLSGDSIELDMDVMRSVQQQRRQGTGSHIHSITAQTPPSSAAVRMASAAPQPMTSLLGVRAMVYLLAMGALFVHFVMISALLDGSSVLVRIVAGLAPGIVAFLWTLLVSSHNIDLEKRWFVPTSLRVLLMLGVFILSMLVLFPGRGKIALKHEAAWFLKNAPEHGFSGVMRRAAQGFAFPVARMCASMDKVLYGAKDELTVGETSETLETLETLETSGTLNTDDDVFE